MKRITFLLSAILLGAVLLTSCSPFIFDPEPHESETTTEQNEPEDTIAEEPEKPEETTAPLPPIDRIPDAVNVADFSAYLDSQNMSHELYQGTLFDQMETYLYQGTPLTDLCAILQFDTETGGGCIASMATPDGKVIGFGDDWEATEDREYADYEIYFHTQIPLEGLDLPYDLEFGDTLEGAFAKIGLELDPLTAFIVDYEEETYAQMVLYREDGQCLALNRRTDGSYKLVYTENYSALRGDGRVTNVTRDLTLSFTDKQDALTLDCLSILVLEHYKLN